ncbi:MAG: hypothetical protein IT438_12045 [Phycisphaerales bacterium]|nr:hypothetical protein [Phycisphaerales bacterium]
MSTKYVRLCAALCAGAVAGSSSSAAVLFASASSGARAASATFDTSGTDLVITLTNTSSADAGVPSEMLTGIFFDIAGAALSLSRSSVLLDAGSIVLNDPAPAGGIVGGEFGYRGGLAGAPHGAAYGVSSSGLGLFGPGDLFPGPDLEPPASPDGVQYGLTTASDPGNNNNGGASVPLIRNAVVITLGGLPANFDPFASIHNISFQYGTGLDEPNLYVPAPGASGLLALGALALRRRRR